MGKETSPISEPLPAIISFARVEDFLAELKVGAPDLNIVRVDTLVRDSQPDKYGLSLRTGSVMITARRGGEILVVTFVTGRLQTIAGKPWHEEEATRLDENLKKAKEVFCGEIQEAGFETRPGIYVIPENLRLYRAISDRVGFREGKIVRLDKVGEG